MLYRFLCFCVPVFLTMAMSSCGRSPPPPPGREGPITLPSREGPGPITLPNGLEDLNYLYAVGTVASKDLQEALNLAKEDARADIARKLETRINSMFKRFRGEVGVGEDAEFLTQTSDVSKSVMSKVMSSLRVAKTKSVKEGMIFRAYVLIEMPIDAANTTLMDAIKKRENMYTRFQASQGFQELEDEVERYKKEQGVAP